MEELSFKKKLFGKEIEFVVYDTDSAIVSLIIEDAYKEALRLQKIFNFFDDSSELSRLNKNRSLKVSPELLEVLDLALTFCELTAGDYDITLGKQILQRKTKQELQALNCSYKDINIKDNLVTLTHKDVMLDLGSIAKGYIADKLAEFLKSHCIENFLVDSRGDIIVSGNYSHVIQVQHPRNEEKAFLSVKLKNCSVATSGDYKQYHETFNKSHILNQKKFISVTAVSKSLMRADAFSTAFFVSSNSEKLINSYKDINILAIDNNLNNFAYNNFNKLILK